MRSEIHVRARVAGGDRRDDQLGDADRQRPRGRRADRGVAGAADAEEAVEPPLPVQALHDLRRAAAHRLDCGAAVVGVAERGDVRSGSTSDLLLPDVGVDLRLEDAGVDEQHVHALLAQPVAEVAVLRALRVQRAEEDDRRHAECDPTGAVRAARPERSRCSRPR
jgi:hypothetical protein